MFHSVRFRNFKALRDVEIALDRFTVLIGPNNSGKTSVLEGLNHLTRLASTEPRAVFEGAADVGVIASRGAEGTFELAFTGTFRGRRGDLSVSFAAIEDYPFTDTYRVEATLGDQRFSAKRELHSLDENEAAVTGPFGASPLALVVREAVMLRFEARRLAAPAYSDLAVPVIAPDGEGLAAVLADMAVSRPDDFQRLQDTMRSLIPGLARIRLARAKVQRKVGEATDHVWGHEIVFDHVGAADVPARAASEGTLILLGLFATLIGPERHRLVLVDHLERAVSPRMLGELVDQLDLTLAQDPKLQLVAVTDSPALLDRLDPRRVRVHVRLTDGSVRVKPMTAHPDFEILRRKRRPGELWMEIGEDWVAEDPPRPRTSDKPATSLSEAPRSRFPATMPPLPGATRPQTDPAPAPNPGSTTGDPP